MAKHGHNTQQTKPEVPTHKEDRIMSPNEVGKMIGKCGQTVRNWCKEGLLDFVQYTGRPKGHFGIRRSDAVRLISNSALADKVQFDGN